MIQTNVALAKAAHALQNNLLLVYTLCAYFLRLDHAISHCVWNVFLICSTIYYASELALHCLFLDNHNWPNILHHIISLFACWLWFTTLQSGHDMQQFCVIFYGILESGSLFALPLRLRLLEKKTIVQREINSQILPEAYSKTLSGIVFSVAFLLSRFVALPIFWLFYAPKKLPHSANYLVYAPLTVLNFFWLGQLIKGLYHELWGKNKSKND